MSGAKACGRGRLTDEDRARILEMAEQGHKATAIARALSRHQSTVQWYLYSTGMRAPSYDPRRPKSYVRNGRIIRLFTPEEDAFIQALRVQDFTLAQIAEAASKRFGTERSAHVIKCRLIMLAAREEAA